MKIKLNELKEMVKSAVQEEMEARVLKSLSGYSTAQALDFSKPLGDGNLYHRQGRSNVGPYTESRALRMLVGKIVSEELACALPEKKGGK